MEPEKIGTNVFIMIEAISTYGIIHELDIKNHIRQTERKLCGVLFLKSKM